MVFECHQQNWVKKRWEISILCCAAVFVDFLTARRSRRRRWRWHSAPKSLDMAIEIFKVIREISERVGRQGNHTHAHTHRNTHICICIGWFCVYCGKCSSAVGLSDPPSNTWSATPLANHLPPPLSPPSTKTHISLAEFLFIDAATFAS